MSFEVLVEFGDSAQSVGRKQPNFAGVRVIDADEDDGNIRVTARKSSDRLLVDGTEFWIAIGTRTEPPQATDEGAVHQHLQFFGCVRSLRLAMRCTHLQVVGGSLVISVLRLLQKSEDSSGRSVASKLIGRAGSRSGRGALQQAGDRLRGQLGGKSSDGNGNGKNEPR